MVAYREEYINHIVIFLCIHITVTMSIHIYIYIYICMRILYGVSSIMIGLNCPIDRSACTTSRGFSNTLLYCYIVYKNGSRNIVNYPDGQTLPAQIIQTHENSFCLFKSVIATNIISIERQKI